MRTWTRADSSTIIHHNGDFSGDLTITTMGGEAITVLAEDIVEFVKECYFKPRIIEAVEEATTKEMTEIMACFARGQYSFGDKE